MRRVTGGSIPAQIWKVVMTAAEHDRPLQPLDRTQEPSPDREDGLVDVSQASYVDDAQVPASEHLPVDGRGNSVALAGSVSANEGTVGRDVSPPRDMERNSVVPPKPPGGEYQALMPAPATDNPVTVPVSPYQAYLQNNRGNVLPADRDASLPAPNPPISNGQSDAPIVTH
jgi:membrane peptidoglycan carboxypeptidase